MAAPTVACWAPKVPCTNDNCENLAEGDGREPHADGGDPGPATEVVGAGAYVEVGAGRDTVCVRGSTSTYAPAHIIQGQK